MSCWNGISEMSVTFLWSKWPSKDLESIFFTNQWRIQDFPGAGAPTPKMGVLTYLFAFLAENCMKMKEFGPRGGGACVPVTPLDTTMQTNMHLVSEEVTINIFWREKDLAGPKHHNSLSESPSWKLLLFGQQHKGVLHPLLV